MLSSKDAVWITEHDQTCSVCGYVIHVRDLAYSKNEKIYCSKDCEAKDRRE